MVRGLRARRPRKSTTHDLGPTTTTVHGVPPTTCGRDSVLDRRVYPAHLDARLLQIASICLLVSMMTYLDITVVTVAQHTFITVFKTTHVVVAWTMTGYTLALATVIPLAGWAADRFGAKRLFISSLSVFTGSSMLCGFAPNIDSLIIFRIVQGLGGGMLLPLILTTLAREAGPKRLGRVVAVMGAPTVLGSAFGPLLGGWLIDSYGWHWIFWINLPFGLAATVMTAILFPVDHPRSSEALDLVGALLLSPGLAALLYGVSAIPDCDSVSDFRVWIPGAIGVAFIVGFVLHALYRSAHPLIDLRLFKNPVVALANMATFLFAAATLGAGLLIPGYFQLVLHQTPLQSGISTVPRGIGAVLTMSLGGLLIDKHGPGKTLPMGIVFSAAGMGIFTYGVSQRADYLPLFATGLTMMGLGWGFVRVPLSAASVRTLRPHQVARGSTVAKVNQQVAASVGTALMTVLLTSQSNRDQNISAANRMVAMQDYSVGRQLPVGPPAVPGRPPNGHALSDLMQGITHAYAMVFLIAAVMITLTLIPVMLLIRVSAPKLPIYVSSKQQG
ncbi:DHA2 family efflux MFS transporter permease subunit [Mycobacterium attenuatum]